MSIFASYVTRTVAIPWDPDQTVTIQKLSAKHLAAARQAEMMAAIDRLRSMGGAAFQRELAALTSDAVKDELTARRSDPLRPDQYEPFVVLEKGIKAWTYPEPVTPETLAGLDQESVDFLVREILTLTLPNGTAEKKTVS